MTDDSPVQKPRRVLVTYGSTRGGTAGIADAIATALRVRHLDVDCVPASRDLDASGYDAIIVGGALHLNRWHRDARRFVRRNVVALRQCRVWMFSSGPLDRSADAIELIPVRGVAKLMSLVAAREHRTFGGYLAIDAEGFVVSALARAHAGDWRDWTRIRLWADQIAGEIVDAPSVVVMGRARSSRWPLALLCLFVGVTAIGGGATLVARPDGALLQMPPSVIEHIPFATFMIPGLVLLLVIGGGHLIAGILVLRDHAFSSSVALVSGIALITWILTQVFFLRTVDGLHVLYLLAGIAIIVEARRRRPVAPPRVGDRPRKTARPAPRDAEVTAAA